MSGPNFNLTTQQAATKNPSIIDIYDESQMPLTLAPDGQMRFAAALDTKYIIHPGVILPRILIPKATTPSIPQVTEFTTAIQASTINISGSSVPHFWGRNIGILALRNINLADSTPQTTKLFDLVGGEFFSSLIMTGVPLLNFGELGNLVDLTLSASNSTFVNFERGIVSRNNTAQFLSSFSSGRIANLSAVTTQSAALCFMGEQSTIGASISNMELDAADSVFCIDSASTGTVDIIGNSFDGVSNFFTQPISATITGAFSDDGLSILSFADSATNPGVDTTVTLNVFLAKLVIGQSVLISNATQGSFNALHTVTRVSDDLISFDIPIVFVTDSTASFNQTVVAAANHGLVKDQTTTIAGTTNYNGTFNILSIVDNNSFTIPAVFVTEAAGGTASATSKDQTDIGVVAALNGKAENSRIIGLGQMNGNTDLTSVAVNAYTALDVTGMAENTVTERFTLTDTDLGEFTYDGDKDITAGIRATVSATKTGSTAEYRFAISVNGATPTFATAPFAPMEVKTTKVQVTIIDSTPMSQTDTIQIMIAGDGTGDDITITDMTLEVLGE